MDSGKAVLVRRDTGEKIVIEQASVVEDVQNLLNKIQVSAVTIGHMPISLCWQGLALNCVSQSIRLTC